MSLDGVANGDTGEPAVRFVPVEAVRPLRHQILRPGKPREASHYPQDDVPTTRHLAVIQDDEVVACATLTPEPYHGEPAWRIRGVATAQKFRRRGYGTALLNGAQEIVVESGAHALWCNVRLSATAFYEGCGFALLGPEFTPRASGVPHKVAVWWVSR